MAEGEQDAGSEASDEDDGFGALLASATEDIRRNARRFFRSPDEIDDLTQTVMLKAWRARSRFVRGSNFAGWLYVILRNSARSEQRSRKLEQGWDDSFDRLLVQQPGQAWSCELVDLGRALPRLSGEQHRALWAIVIEGQTLDEVAQAERVTPRAIKSRICRARRSLERLTSEASTIPIGLGAGPFERPGIGPALHDPAPVRTLSECDRQQVAVLRAFLERRACRKHPAAREASGRAAA